MSGRLLLCARAEASSTTRPISPMVVSENVLGNVEPTRSPPRCMRETAVGQSLETQRLLRRGRTVSGCPFCLDLFHRFADVRQRDGAGEADAERFLIADEHGDVTLRTEPFDFLELARFELIAQAAQRSAPCRESTRRSPPGFSLPHCSNFCCVRRFRRRRQTARLCSDRNAARPSIVRERPRVRGVLHRSSARSP